MRQQVLPAVWLIASACAARGQATRYVNAACGDDRWTGADPVCVAPDGPKRSIQAALDASADGDTVVVANGRVDIGADESVRAGGAI